MTVPKKIAVMLFREYISFKIETTENLSSIVIFAFETDVNPIYVETAIVAPKSYRIFMMNSSAHFIGHFLYAVLLVEGVHDILCIGHNTTAIMHIDYL